jgi:hypothetical protein
VLIIDFFFEGNSDFILCPSFRYFSSSQKKEKPQEIEAIQILLSALLSSSQKKEKPQETEVIQILFSAFFYLIFIISKKSKDPIIYNKI